MALKALKLNLVCLKENVCMYGERKKEKRMGKLSSKQMKTFVTAAVALVGGGFSLNSGIRNTYIIQK